MPHARCLLIWCASVCLAGCRAPSPAPPPDASAPESSPATPAARAPVRLTTAEGLIIEDLSVGSGDACPAGATVEVNFVARFADGREFDSSDARRRPLTLPLGRPSVIRGLREGVPGMRVGGRRRLTIPWPLAYGAAGREPIPPKTDLVFEIELLTVR